MNRARSLNRARMRTFAFSALAALPAVLGAAHTPSAHAASSAVAQCLSANEDSLKARGAHKLKEARAQALICAAGTCPTDVRNECAKRVSDINAAIPSIIFDVKNEAGEDVPGVKVRMDGDAAGSAVDGSAVEIDPGEHAFTFSVASSASSVDLSAQKTFVLREGEKARHEPVIMKSTTAAGTQPTSSATGATTGTPPEKPRSGGMKIAGIVLGGVGLVGVGLGTYFGLSASSAWSSQQSNCGSPTKCPNRAQAIADHDNVTSNGLASTISFAAGGALLGAGLLLFVLSPSSGSKVEEAGTLHVVPAFGPKGGDLSAAWTF